MSREIDFRYAPTIRQSCIGFADDPHKTIVREDGSLNYGYQGGEVDWGGDYDVELGARAVEPRHRNYKFTTRLKPTFTHEDTLVERTQEYGDPSEAIVETRETYEDTDFSWKAFAHRTEGGHRVDVVLWELSASEDFGRASSTVELSLDGSAEATPEIIESPGSTAYWNEYGFRSRELTNYEFLTSNEMRTGAFAVVLEGDLDAERVTVEWATEALEQTRQYWQSLEPFDSTFRIPDEQVKAMLKSCGRNILQAREEHDGVVEYQVGPTQYRGLWIVDGHFILEAAHMMGRGEDAFEQGLLALLRRVKLDGSIQNLPMHDKETGIALATIVRQCELADDDDRLRELWPTMQRALDFLREQREDAIERGEEYAGIFPPAVLDGGIGGPYPDHTTPLWILAGVKAAADAGERLNLDGAVDFRVFYDEIREAFEESAHRDLRTTEDGIPYIPMNMENRDGFDRPQSATWAFAHAIYPGEVFDLEDKHVKNLLALLDSVDDTQGIPENTGWIHDQGIWTYASMFYAQVWLYAGYPETAVDYLYAFANHAAPSRVWREEQSFVDSPAAEFVGDMPHNWASAEFIRMVRNLLVFEREDSLELLPGLPQEWLPTDRRSLALGATPTKYGTVDLELERNGDEYRLTIDRAEGNREPERVLLHWDGEVVNASSHLEASGEGRWRLPDDCRSLTVRLRD